MNRSLPVIAAFTVAVTSGLVASAPANAQATTGPETATARDGVASEAAWTRYRRFDSMVLCEAAGAAGVMLGRWIQWRCDDQNVLWVVALQGPWANPTP
ncbi:hypothetical protein AB0M48_25400 [Lentzea sp. NPDC051208]|uniref:hypothetical protein n=1 Tax=Lentzea sp. NPDC051208 TaxID=3154642 RepID=UPI0034276962